MCRYLSPLFLIITLFSNNCLAWNSSAHKIIADISWQLLAPQKRDHLTQLLREHPRYQEDLLRHLPANIQGTKKQEKWAFVNASVWPDQIANKSARLKKRFHHPTWHYINIPIFLENQKLSIKENLSFRVHDPAYLHFNIVQALQYNAKQLQNQNITAQERAIAVSWILHLIGDIHQPLHAASLYSSVQFPYGDRGGNLIPIRQAIGQSNLHSIWDSIFSRAKSTRTIERKAKELLQANINQTYSFQPQDWSEESHLLATNYVYTRELLVSLQARPSSRNMIHLSSEYTRQAKQIATKQILLAGHRTAALLNKINFDPLQE